MKIDIVFRILAASILISLPLAAQSNAVASSIGDGGPAKAAILNWPSGVAIDGNGNIYVAERRANRIRKIEAASGIISTITGNGSRGFGGDGGPANKAVISIPELIAVDAAGNLYFTDRGNYRIRCVDAQSGIINTVAGNGEYGYSGDGGPATAAGISAPFGVLVGTNGNLFIADTENHVIRRVNAESGIIETVAGSGEKGFGGDGGPALKAQMNRPHNFAIDAAGNLFIGDSQNQRIRFVDKNSGIISTLYGSGEQGISKDGIPAKDAAFFYFGSLLFDRQDNLIIAGWVDNRIRRIDRASGIISTMAGTGEEGFAGDGGPATAAQIRSPYGMALDSQGNLYFAEAENHRIRRIDAQSGIISTFAGGKAPE